MDNINWDKWQKEVDEHNPNCPWIDRKPIDDGIWDGPDDEDEEDGEDDE